MKTNGKKFSSFESDFKFLWKWNGKGRVPITITYDKKNPSNYSIKELKQIQSSQNSKLVLPFIGILWIVLAIFIITSEIRLSFAENTKYYPYQNQKYHFEVDLPTRIPEFGLEATSEEGVALTAYHDSINIAIYGYGIPDFTALKKEYQKQIREKEKTLGYYILGKDFFIRSIRTIIITSLIMDFVAPLFPVYEGDMMLAAICTGVLSGLGYALIFMRGSSTGGSDFIMLSIKELHPHLSLGNISFAMEAVVILAGTILVSKNIDGLIYGMLISFILSVMVDKV
ncbi:YitT family protein, partial [Fusobacterium gonidiaformans]|uniref:YitT family protein n=1 Tax=Fusobacterium gonidiaformans TaxID=849 RepID=UPI0023F032CA